MDEGNGEGLGGIRGGNQLNVEGGGVRRNDGVGLWPDLVLKHTNNSSISNVY